MPDKKFNIAKRVDQYLMNFFVQTTHSFFTTSAGFRLAAIHITH